MFTFCLVAPPVGDTGLPRARTAACCKPACSVLSLCFLHAHVCLAPLKNLGKSLQQNRTGKGDEFPLCFTFSQSSLADGFVSELPKVSKYEYLAQESNRVGYTLSPSSNPKGDTGTPRG